jgi:glucose 1-dehydrogenase
VKVPKQLKDAGVLLEPMTVAQKGITQAYEIQRRMKVWRPKKAAVMGAGTLGLLASLVLRLRGLDVTTFGRTPRPYLNADLLEAIGSRYINTAERSIEDAPREFGPFDLIFEGTGSSSVVFDSALALAKNGPRVVQHHGRRPEAGDPRRSHQSGVRTGQQSDGGDREREPLPELPRVPGSVSDRRPIRPARV